MTYNFVFNTTKPLHSMKKKVVHGSTFYDDVYDEWNTMIGIAYLLFVNHNFAVCYLISFVVNWWNLLLNELCVSYMYVNYIQWVKIVSFVILLLKKKVLYECFVVVLFMEKKYYLIHGLYFKLISWLVFYLVCSFYFVD